MMYAIKYRNTYELFAPFASKLYCLIPMLPLALWPQKFMKCA